MNDSQDEDQIETSNTKKVNIIIKIKEKIT